MAFCLYCKYSSQFCYGAFPVLLYLMFLLCFHISYSWSRLCVSSHYFLFYFDSLPYVNVSSFASHWSRLLISVSCVPRPVLIPSFSSSIYCLCFHLFGVSSCPEYS